MSSKKKPRVVLLALLVVALALFASCNKPDLAKPRVHENAKVSFTLPGNWGVTTTDERFGEISTTTFIVDAGDGIASVVVFSPAVPVDLDELQATMLKSIAAELASYSVGPVELLKKVDGTRESATRKIGGVERTGFRSHFTLTALGERVKFTSELYSATGPTTSAAIFYQTADDDLARDMPGFELLFNSVALR